MQTSEKTPSQTENHIVADISLSGFGRKEIEIAEHEMPGLMSIRKKYATEKPLNGIRITNVTKILTAKSPNDRVNQGIPVA